MRRRWPCLEKAGTASFWSSRTIASAKSARQNADTLWGPVSPDDAPCASPSVSEPPHFARLEFPKGAVQRFARKGIHVWAGAPCPVPRCLPVHRASERLSGCRLGRQAHVGGDQCLGQVSGMGRQEGRTRDHGRNAVFDSGLPLFTGKRECPAAFESRRSCG